MRGCVGPPQKPPGSVVKARVFFQTPRSGHFVIYVVDNGIFCPSLWQFVHFSQYSDRIQKPTVQAASQKLDARLVSSATPHHTPRNEARGAHRCVECRFAIVRGAARPWCSRCQATQAACGPVTTSMRWHNAIQAPANGFVCYCLGTGSVIGRDYEGGFLPRKGSRKEGGPAQEPP